MFTDYNSKENGNFYRSFNTQTLFYEKKSIKFHDLWPISRKLIPRIICHVEINPLKVGDLPFLLNIFPVNKISWNYVRNLVIFHLRLFPSKIIEIKKFFYCKMGNPLLRVRSKIMTFPNYRPPLFDTFS